MTNLVWFGLEFDTFQSCTLLLLNPRQDIIETVHKLCTILNYKPKLHLNLYTQFLPMSQQLPPWKLTG